MNSLLDYGPNVPLSNRNIGGNECSGDQSLYNGFWMEHLDFTDPSLHDTCRADIVDTTKFRIPKIVHLIFNIQPNGMQFLFFHYMAIKMAKISIKPDKILFHYVYEPTGHWWEKAKKLVVMMKLDSVPEEIFGNAIHEHAHKADVVRLEKLIEHGGIYIDIDVFVYRSLDPLLHHSAVMGKEDEHGLCNGIILAEPHSRFLRTWYSTYTTFNDSHWNEHSVLMPKGLSMVMGGGGGGGDVCVLPRVSFFYPSFYPNHHEFVHERDEYLFYNGYQYAYHASNHGAWKWIKDVTPDKVRNKDTSFHRLVRPFLDETDVGDFSF